MNAANRPLGGILGEFRIWRKFNYIFYSYNNEILLAIIVAILLIILIRGKGGSGGGRTFNIKGKISKPSNQQNVRPSQQPISRPYIEPIRPIKK